MGETGKMAKACLGLVLVEFGYEYENQDGCMVSIKPNERYTLLSKTNDHWWHVRKDECTKPFYIPAKYVKELPSTLPSPLDFVDAPVPKPAPTTLAVSDVTEKTKINEVTIRTRSPKNHRKTENRMSTFGVPLDIQEPPSYMYGGSVDPIISLHPVSASDPPKNKRLSVTPNILLASHESSQKPRSPSLSPADILLRQAKPVEPPVLKNPITTRPQVLPLKAAPLIEPEEESSPIKTPSSDSENIYESITDLHLEDLVKTEPAVPHDPAQGPTSSTLQGKQERENPTMAVYANIAELKKLAPRIPTASTSTCSSPGLSLSPTPDSPEWEGGPEQDNGKMFNPSLPAGMDASALPGPGIATPSAPALSPLPPALSPGSDWERLVDELTGKSYYYSATLNQTSWDAPEMLSPQQEGPPPLPEEDYPTNEREVKDPPLSLVKLPVPPRFTLDPGTPVPPGWSCSTEPGGKRVFTSDHTHQKWIQSKDEKGKTYYYPKDGSASQWNLPEVTGLGNGMEHDGLSVLKNWRPVPQEDTKFFPSHRRISSDQSTDSSSTANSADPHQEVGTKLRRNLSSTDAHLHPLHHPHHHALPLEKAGILNKTKIADNNKKLRKNWAQSWTVLHGGILTFYKDPKSTQTGNVTRTNQIVPEFTLELKGASVGWATRDKSSKKNVLELKTRHGSEYLIQYDTDSIIHDWHKIIQDTIKHLDHDHYSEDEDDDVMDKSVQPVERERKNTATRQSTSGTSDAEQSRVRTKLRKFLQRRPTLQSVKEKGYIKDNVFGCHLDTLCHRENTTVPRFVEKCIKAVERKGLNIDGIYRVSGNLAVIQRLRHKADHEEDLDLEDGQWEEIHVITGALKLFFRELPEPLFPYSFFDKFIAAIQFGDISQRVSYMRDLVQALPLPNHTTMEVLFRHLRRVIDHTESNRMSSQSLAIVFGPTLLRPEEESGNMAVHMVFQNQIVELILSKFNDIFSPR